MDIAPEAISNDELAVTINNVKANVIGINKVVEYWEGTSMYAYLIQIQKPESYSDENSEYDRIAIVLHSKETKNKRLAFVFRNG